MAGAVPTLSIDDIDCFPLADPPVQEFLDVVAAHAVASAAFTDLLQTFSKTSLRSVIFWR
jgi:hypothetical protein